MKIKLTKPHAEYPFAWVEVETDYKKDDPDKLGFDLAVVLDKHRITLLGPWATVSSSGSVVSMKAPALLEDEHIKPPKKRTRTSKK